MKNTFLLIILSLLASTLLPAQEDFRSKAPAPGPARKVEMGEYQEFKLDNGLRVIVVENRKLPRVSFQLLVDLPPIQENDMSGLADMTGQMMARGTKTRSKAQIDETIDFIGATLNTSASGIFGACLSKHREKLLEIMQDVLINPAFTEEEFEKLKKQTISGLISAKDNPDAISGNVSRVLAFGKNHPYGEMTTEKTVENIKIQNIKSFYESLFRPEISYLAIVGDISPEEAKRLAERYFAGWKKGTILKDFFEAPKAPANRQVAFVNKTGAVQSVLNVTYPVQLKPGSADAIKASVMNTLFGGFFSSRLNANIREDKGYSYGVRSSLSPDREVASFSAGGSVRNDVTDSTIVEFLHEMKRLRTEPVSDDELAMVKSVMNGNFARSLEVPETVARYALNTARYRLPKDYYATYLEKLSQVTAKDVTDMALKYLLPDNAYIVVVGNQDIAPRLARFAASGKVDFYDLYGNSMENNFTLLPDGIDAETVISDYINAIGGAKTLAGVKDMSATMKTEVQGMAMQMSQQKKAPGKMAMTITMSGMTINQIKCDGNKVEVMQMGQKQPLDEKTAAATKQQAVMFPELLYKERGYALELKGIEAVDDKKAYRIDITSPDGDKTSEYFDMTTSLKIRSVSSQDTPQGPASVINDYDDYREVKGVRIPYKVTISGAMPFPLVMQVESAAINEGIDDKVFTIK
jgi:zinc protease